MIHRFVERGTFVHKGHAVRFTILEDDTVRVEEKFGKTEGIPKRIDIDEAIEYQEQLKEIGYGKEN
jgi:hypothetical protein|tara:strand:+ start:243 stop:440 length:198 start_codon:yes stop_codon:yes gene_type:complete